MGFFYTEKVKQWQKNLNRFMEDYIYPNEQIIAEQLKAIANRWESVPTKIEELKEKAKAAGLWNLFLPDNEYGAGLTNEFRVCPSL